MLLNLSVNKEIKSEWFDLEILGVIMNGMEKVANLIMDFGLESIKDLKNNNFWETEGMEMTVYFPWNTKIFAIILIKCIYAIFSQLLNMNLKNCIVIKSMVLFINLMFITLMIIFLNFISQGFVVKLKKKFSKV